MSEPCELCTSDNPTGPDASTPTGICVACACSACRGFRRIDDRGFIIVSQPFLTATDCISCGGVGTRAGQERRFAEGRAP